MALPEFTRNLGVVFLTSVTGSPADNEEITLPKHAREDAFHGCMVTLPVKSKLASAIVSGPTSKDDLETIARHIRTLFNQDGWQEVRCPGDRERPHYWCNRIFPPMTCRTRPVLAVDGVVCCEGLVWHRTFHNHAGRDYWGTNPGIGFRPALFDRVAFVPAWRSNRKIENEEHALWQMLHFEDVNDGFVRSMPLLDLCEEC